MTKCTDNSHHSDRAIAIILEHLPIAPEPRGAVLTEVLDIIGEEHPLREEIIKQLCALDWTRRHQLNLAFEFRRMAEWKGFES